MSYKDFDRFFDELNHEEKPAIQIKLFDKTYTLPHAVPATMVLASYRAIKQGRENIETEDEVIMMVEALGEDNVEEWVAHGITKKQLMEIFYWVIRGCEDETKAASPTEVKEEISGKKS